MRSVNKLIKSVTESCAKEIDSPIKGSDREMKRRMVRENSLFHRRGFWEDSEATVFMQILLTGAAATDSRTLEQGSFGGTLMPLAGPLFSDPLTPPLSCPAFQVLKRDLTYIVKLSTAISLDSENPGRPLAFALTLKL